MGLSGGVMDLRRLSASFAIFVPCHDRGHGRGTNWDFSDFFCELNVSGCIVPSGKPVF